jgi:hypothetical protein
VLWHLRWCCVRAAPPCHDSGVSHHLAKCRPVGMGCPGLQNSAVSTECQKAKARTHCQPTGLTADCSVSLWSSAADQARRDLLAIISPWHAALQATFHKQLCLLLVDHFPHWFAAHFALQAIRSAHRCMPKAVRDRASPSSAKHCVSSLFRLF